jgi:hypothetical protein
VGAAAAVVLVLVEGIVLVVVGMVDTEVEIVLDTGDAPVPGPQ